MKLRHPHEQEAFRQIKNTLRDQDSFRLLENFELYDPELRDFWECDLVVVFPCGLSIIELKHWAGHVEIGEYNWKIRNKGVRSQKNPHVHNSMKCRLLKGLLERKFPTVKSIFINSIVVLTHPEVTGDRFNFFDDFRNGGFRIPSLTFRDIPTLARHFEFRMDNFEHRLAVSDMDKIYGHLASLHESQPQSSFIPGYELIKNLSDTRNKREILVRSTKNELQSIHRLRIYLPDNTLDPEKQRQQQARSLNSLKALSKIGEHPNIIKFWEVPNEHDYLIEASDWSEEGTLATMLEESGKLQYQQALEIMYGILNGLEAAHIKNVIHRDVRPDNILMKENVPKLMNFDLSFIPGKNRQTVFPDPGSLEKPSTLYLAPELCQGRETSQSTDLFSVGVIAYTMLCGHEPFLKTVDLADSEGTLSDPAILQLKQEIQDPEIFELIKNLIQLEPQKRPQSAREIKKILRPLLKNKTDSSIPKDSQLDKGSCHDTLVIEKLIGSGSEAQIYKARQLDETVTIKLFNHDVPRERISNIQKILERLHSPSIIAFKGVHKWEDNRFYLVLNYIDGESLDKKIENNIQPSLPDFCHVAQCLFSAVQEMHRNSILHNDLKPGNILIDRENNPVIIDFGTASEPRTSLYKGTRPYSAPDLFSDTDFEFCESGDLYALALTLFEWFCGILPFEGYPTLHSKAKLVSFYRQDSPELLTQWFEKALQPQKPNRFADIISMREAILPMLNEFLPVDDRVLESTVPEIPTRADNQKDAGISSFYHPLLPLKLIIGYESDDHARPIFWEYGHKELKNPHLAIFSQNIGESANILHGIALELSLHKQHALIFDMEGCFSLSSMSDDLKKRLKIKQTILALTPIGINPFAALAIKSGGSESMENCHAMAQRLSGVFEAICRLDRSEKQYLYEMLMNILPGYGDSLNFEILLEKIGKDERITNRNLSRVLMEFKNTPVFDPKLNETWTHFYLESNYSHHSISFTGLDPDQKHLAADLLLYDLHLKLQDFELESQLNNIIISGSYTGLTHPSCAVSHITNENLGNRFSVVFIVLNAMNLPEEHLMPVRSAAQRIIEKPSTKGLEPMASLLSRCHDDPLQTWVERLNALKTGEFISDGPVLDRSTGKLYQKLQTGRV